MSEEEILQWAVANGVKRIALTDINSTSGSLNFVRLAQRHHVTPVLGIDFRNRAQCIYIGLAKNNEGFQELNTFLSYHKHSETELPVQAPHFEHAFIIYPFKQLKKTNKQTFLSHEYIGLAPDDLLSFAFSAWKHELHKCVVLAQATFLEKMHVNTHRLLRAIDNNTLLSKLPAEQQANEKEIFLPPEKIKNIYKDLPQVIRNTETILEQCSIHFDFSKDKPSQNIKTYTGDVLQDTELLKKLCTEGLANRYTVVSTTVQQRLTKELDMIQQMNFVSFFLVNWDIIHYAQHKNYYHVGRGSGANSIVAYLLGITDVDPIELDLYFERFMNLYRTTPPDFDIDFSTKDRPDITRYIFERFGKKGQAALLAAYSTFQFSAAVRELGKVFGLPKHEIDVLSDGNFQYEKLDHISQLVLRYAKRLEDKPNYLTVHAAGILISEKLIHYFTATDLPPKGFPTTHFDMHVAEDVGLHKFDILGQRGLGKIKDTLQIIKHNQPHIPPIDIHNTKPMMTDPEVNAMVKSSQCIGCFYVESPAMRTLIKKLEVDNYLTLVAASSIIRPGVSNSGMMREYILRHRDPERRKLAHPVMWNIMPDTYGVMVYQEDVIKVAHYFAGLTLGEADVLRRGMSGKYRSREEFLQVKEKFISNCRAKGYTDALTMEVWNQTESFAGYAFAKGHSASYAVESYQSLYLKKYFPLEYMVAVINNGGGFYSTELYVHEARMCGAIISTCCINKGHWHTSIEGKEIRLGFQHILGMEKSYIETIIAERQMNGVYASFDDFLNRVAPQKELLLLLIRVGAFNSVQPDRRKLLWLALFNTQNETEQPLQYRLFEKKRVQFSLPQLSISELETAYEQLELFGFFLMNPFFMGKEMHLYPDTTVQQMEQQVGKPFSITGYLVTIKNTRTHKGESMLFGTFIDRNGHWLDTVHFPPVARQYPFKGRGLYLINGIVKNDHGAIILEAQSIKRIHYIDDPRYV